MKHRRRLYLDVVLNERADETKAVNNMTALAYIATYLSSCFYLFKKIFQCSEEFEVNVRESSIPLIELRIFNHYHRNVTSYQTIITIVNNKDYDV